MYGSIISNRGTTFPPFLNYVKGAIDNKITFYVIMIIK